MNEQLHQALAINAAYEKALNEVLQSLEPVLDVIRSGHQPTDIKTTLEAVVEDVKKALAG